MTARVINLQPGAFAAYQGRRIKVVRLQTLSEVLVDFLDDGTTQIVGIEDIRPYDGPEVEVPTELSQLDERQRAMMELRHSIIRELQTNPSRRGQDVEAAGRLIGRARSTTYRILNRFDVNRTATSVLPQKPTGGRGKSRLPPEREQKIQEAIDQKYATAQRIRISDLAEEIGENYNTIASRIRQRDQEKLTAKREGQKVARDRYRAVPGYSPSGTFPFEVIQIDHTKADLMPVSADERRQPIGRPNMTLAIDEFSRCVVAFVLSWEPPSALTVALCLQMMMMRKETWLAKRNLSELRWPIAGKPRTVFTDNGAEFESNGLLLGAEKYGFSLQKRPLGSPGAGGIIERLIGTVLGKQHLLPGTTKSNPTSRGKYDSAANAVLTLEEAERVIANDILGAYHERYHKGLEGIPIKTYERAILGDRNRGIIGIGMPEHVYSEHNVLYDFLPYARRKVTRAGIQLFERPFYDGILRQFVVGEAAKHKQIVRYDPRNLRSVFLWDDSIADYHVIPCSDPTLPEVTLAEWERHRKEKAADNVDVDRRSIATSAERRREMLGEATKKTKRANAGRDRERATRALRESTEDASNLIQNRAAAITEREVQRQRDGQAPESRTRAPRDLPVDDS